MYSCICLSSVYENWFLDRYISANEFSGNKFELDKKKNLRKKEKQLSSQYDSDHLRAS